MMILVVKVKPVEGFRSCLARCMYHSHVHMYI